jgi:O-antigen ligase
MWMIPFWFCIAFISLYPSTQAPILEFSLILFNSKDLILVALGCFYLLPVIRQTSVGSYLNKSWSNSLPAITTAILGYAAISVTWSDMGFLDMITMLYTLVLTFFVFHLSYNLIAKMPVGSLRPFLWQLTVFIALISLLYSAQSFFSLDLRSSSNLQNDSFGIDRVRGPLFGSSTGYFLLIPALAFSIQEIANTTRKEPFKWIVMLILGTTILSLGSRGGVVITLIFIISLIFFLRDRKQRLFAYLVGAIMMLAITFTIIGVAANTSRFTSTESDGRSETYSTSFEIVKNRSIFDSFLGSGYGSYWHWYRIDTDGEILDGSVSTQYGTMLPHPHSTFLLLLVEIGLPGLLYFFKLNHILLNMISKNNRNTSDTIFFCGVATSGLSLFFDFFIFKNWTVSMIWLIYFFGALALIVQPEKVILIGSQQKLLALTPTGQQQALPPSKSS